jgi:hypothetical protein
MMVGENVSAVIADDWPFIPHLLRSREFAVRDSGALPLSVG